MSALNPEPTANSTMVSIDLDAFRHNVRVIRSSLTPGARFMAVLKADAYGHGLVPCAKAAVEAGADWLGVAHIEDAITLREAGLTGRILAWLQDTPSPGQREALRYAVQHGIDVSAAAPWILREIISAAKGEQPARVHLKIDTGMGRNGLRRDEFGELIRAAMDAEKTGTVHTVGIWSHLASADEPGNPTIRAQLEVFNASVADLEAAGAELEVRHIANSAATLSLPESHFDLVRVGVSLYGQSPFPDYRTAQQLQLRPVMTLTSRLGLVKQIQAGAEVSYGGTYRAASATRLGLVPLGYGDGILRSASSRGPVLAGGRTARIAGRVCMDQFMIDLGQDSQLQAGDEVMLFGEGVGAPSAQDWADAAGTISYEILTSIKDRLPHRYLNVVPAPNSQAHSDAASAQR